MHALWLQEISLQHMMSSVDDRVLNQTCMRLFLDSMYYMQSFREPVDHGLCTMTNQEDKLCITIVTPLTS
jgi:hypothetical protein